MGILINELSALYRGLSSKVQADPLPALPVQYADYAAWQRRMVERAGVEEAGRVLEAGAGGSAGAAGTADRPAATGPAGLCGRGGGDRAGGGLTRGLKALGQRHGATLYMTLLAGWAALLARLSGQEEVVIGSPVANRTRLGDRAADRILRQHAGAEDRCVGIADVWWSCWSESSSGRWRRSSIRTFRSSRWWRSRSRRGVWRTAPVFQVMLAWQNAPGGELELPGLRLSPLETPHDDGADSICRCRCRREGERIVGGLEYATALFDRETVERYLGYWRSVAGGDGGGRVAGGGSLVCCSERRSDGRCWRSGTRPRRSIRKRSASTSCSRSRWRGVRTPSR